MSHVRINQQSAVDQFAEFVLGTNFNAIPHSARQASTQFFLDTVAVGIAGSQVDSARAVQETARQWGDGSVATVLGSGTRMPVTSAAFINSFQIHCQEFDCLHEPATVHAMAVLGGALLGMAEDQHYSGEDLILGVTLGVDVAANLGLAATTGLRFFRPATAGALGATAALARLENFSTTQFKDAWGLVYSQLSGTMQAHVEGSVALPLQVAVAARSVITSIQLVKQGLTGPHDVLEGPFGYFKLFEQESDLDPILDSLGKVWRVTELSHKPFPTGRAAHGTLDALQQLAQSHEFEMNDIAAINAYVPPLVKRLVDRPIKAQMSVNYARLCLQYLVPVYLQNGRLDTNSYTNELLGSVDILLQGKKVQVIDDGNPDPNALGPQRLEVILANGDRLARDIPHTLGSPSNPLTSIQCIEKYRHCLQQAKIGSDQSNQLLDCLQNLSTLGDTTELMRLTY